MSFNLYYSLTSTLGLFVMLSKALKLTKIWKWTKLEKYAKKIIIALIVLNRELCFLATVTISSHISIFVITCSQVTILLFLLIPDELLFAFLYLFHFFHQGPDLLGVQSLDIDDHCVPDSYFLEKLYLLLCLEFLYFLCQSCQILKLITRHYLHVVWRETCFNGFRNSPAGLIDRGQRLDFFLLFKLHFSHVPFAVSSDLMITLLEISGKTDKIRVQLIVLHTVQDNKLDIRVYLVDRVILIIVDFSFYRSQIHRLFDNVEVIVNVKPLNVDWFSERQGYDVFLKAWDDLPS